MVQLEDTLEITCFSFLGKSLPQFLTCAFNSAGNPSVTEKKRPHLLSTVLVALQTLCPVCNFHNTTLAVRPFYRQGI